MAKLNYYRGKDNDEEEFIAIITAEEINQELINDNDLRLIKSVELDGDYSDWPTDRLLEAL